MVEQGAVLFQCPRTDISPRIIDKTALWSQKLKEMFTAYVEKGNQGVKGEVLPWT